MSLEEKRQTSVLIVDDETSIRTTLSVFLRDNGYQADTAEDAGTALEMLKRQRVDIVVSDIVMPRISGVALLRQIREASPGVYVLMMTGEPTVETASEAVRAGACDYLTKPVTKAAILRAVANAARMKELEDDKRRLEAENLQYRKNLEQTVEQRTHELQEALNRLKKSQEQLIQQERMNALGQMASGIAHDFNNALMPIAGFSDILLSEPNALDNRQETIHMLEMIRSASEDAQHIVQRLRQFHKIDDTEYGPVALAKVLESAISITMPKWKEEMNAKGTKVDVKTAFQDVPLVRGNVSELREAFTNLIFNAVDAMPDGGTIALRLWLEKGRGVVLEVSDTGTGMDETTRRRCIEPFFTTKGARGTGLGLSMVHGIVERHAGSMEIASEPGAGTTIRMLFPVPSDILTCEDETQEEPEPIPPLRVLVIDDEVRSRDIIARILKDDGHAVETAEGGQEGLEMLHHGEYDLVITDRAMPAVSGDEVAREIHRTKPHTPVIMLTGFGDIMKDKGELPCGVARIMTKPVTPNDLRHVMSRVLRGAAGTQGQPLSAQ